MKYKIFYLSVLLLLSSSALAESKHVNPTLNVVATTGMVSNIVASIGGNEVSVTTLMGAGVDPHLYRPNRDDIVRLTNSDVIFYNGLLLEGRMTDALVRVATAGRKVYPVTELLSHDFLLEPPEFNGHPDPHVWMDPIAWKETIPLIEEKLSELLPAKQVVFKKNAEALTSEFNSLHEYSVNVLSSVPAESRVLVTAHDAFNYFGRRYGYEVVGIQGISTESEAGVQDIEKIVTILVNRKVQAVFVESTVSERNIKALIEGAAAKGHKVSIGGTLFSDAMGNAGTYEGTYIGMIDHNVTTIAKALGGKVPPRGFIGRLSELKLNE